MKRSSRGSRLASRNTQSYGKKLTLDRLVHLMHDLVIVDIGLPAMDVLDLAVPERGVESRP